ncbi:MAG: MmgE/PrpD family protein, partial [Verrucomicrobiota bacterium]
VRRTILKRYNSEVHSQSAVEGVIGLITEGRVDARDIAHIRVEIFDVAHLIIGGGAEGNKTIVRTKEAADHSLPYIVAVAALDRELGPAQYSPERILRRDVQSLLRRVEVVPDPGLSARFPDEHACRLTVALRDGRILTREMSDYEGFHTRPMSWERAVEKYLGIAGATRGRGRLEKVIEAVGALENLTAREFAARLS